MRPKEERKKEIPTSIATNSLFFFLKYLPIMPVVLRESSHSSFEMKHIGYSMPPAPSLYMIE